MKRKGSEPDISDMDELPRPADYESGGEDTSSSEMTDDSLGGGEDTNDSVEGEGSSVDGGSIEQSSGDGDPGGSSGEGGGDGGAGEEPPPPVLVVRERCSHLIHCIGGYELTPGTSFWRPRSFSFNDCCYCGSSTHMHTTHKNTNASTHFVYAHTMPPYLSIAMFKSIRRTCSCQKILLV
jgi:hypothetical protein